MPRCKFRDCNTGGEIGLETVVENPTSPFVRPWSTTQEAEPALLTVAACATDGGKTTTELLTATTNAAAVPTLRTSDETFARMSLLLAAGALGSGALTRSIRRSPARGIVDLTYFSMR
jgi:hypothetical protein